MDNRERTFYDILGLSAEATPAQISGAFRTLVKEHHPDRFKDPARKAEAERSLKEVTEAYNTLCRPTLRQEYDRSLARPQSSAVQKSSQEQVRELVGGGIARFRSGDYTSALAMFDHVLRMDPTNDQALFHGGMIRLRNPKWRNQGTQQVERAIEVNPYSAAYVTAYAEFLLENGLNIRAQRLLESALDNHPTDLGLQNLLAQARGNKPSGFSLFRKK